MVPRALYPLARQITKRFPSLREYYVRYFYPRIYCRFFRIIAYYIPGFYKLYWNGLKGKSTRKVITREDISGFSQYTKDAVCIKKSDFRFKISGKEVAHIDKPVTTKVNSIGGWVPYIKDKTTVSAFHFFSVNYTIRKQALIRISLIDNLKVLKQESFWLPAFRVHDFDLRKYFSGLEGNSVYLEIFHPRIDKNHASWYDLPGAHLRFWSKYYNENGEFLSTVHSVPHHHWVRYDHREPWGRARFPENTPGGNCKHFSITHTEPGETRENFIGFNIIEDQEGNARAAWHKASKGPTPYEIGENSSKMTQAFWVPDLKGLDPVFFIDDVETSISRQKIKIYLVKGANVLKTKEFNVDGYFSASVSEVFGENVGGPYCVICEYTVNHYAFLNFCYNTKERVGDGNHAFDCFWNVDDGKLVPQYVQSRGAARKFSHFQKSDYSFKNILVMHSHPVKDEVSSSLKVRIFTDKGTELLKSINVNSYQPFFTFDIKDLFPEIYQSIEASGVIQIESITENYDAAVMHLNLTNSNIAIEHMTGA